MFKTLTLGRLPRVMVRTLSMPAEDRAIVFREILRLAEDAHKHGAVWPAAFMEEQLLEDQLATAFSSILGLPKEDRRVFVDVLDDVLEKLLEEDFFGTEGQSDPRGDHRDNG